MRWKRYVSDFSSCHVNITVTISFCRFCRTGVTFTMSVACTCRNLFSSFGLTVDRLLKEKHALYCTCMGATYCMGSVFVFCSPCNFQEGFMGCLKYTGCGCV